MKERRGCVAENLGGGGGAMGDGYDCIHCHMYEIIKNENNLSLKEQEGTASQCTLTPVPLHPSLCLSSLGHHSSPIWREGFGTHSLLGPRSLAIVCGSEMYPRGTYNWSCMPPRVTPFMGCFLCFCCFFLGQCVCQCQIWC